MKKISSLIVCLAILALGTAFALELPDALKFPGLTVTGDVRTGLLVEGATYDTFGEDGVFTKDADGEDRETGALDPSVRAYSDDLGDGTPFRAQLQLVWEQDNLGVKTRFRYRPDSSGNFNGTLSNLNNTVNKAFVYAKLFDEKVKVSVGKGTDEAWALFYSSFANDKETANTTGFDGKDGVKIEVMPIEGLNVGAFYGTDNLFGKAFKGDGFVDGTEDDRRLVVGAKYVSDFFSVVATTAHNFVEPDIYINSYFYDGNTFAYEATQNVPAPMPGTSNLLVGLQVKPIEPLQLDLSVAAVNLGSKTVKSAFNGGEDAPGIFKKGDFNPFWMIFPKLEVAYAVNEQIGVALAVADIIIADEYYYKDADATDPEDKGVGGLFPITISPSATYAINDDVTAGLELGFKINSGASDQFGIGFKPSAEFSLGSGATFVVFDELTFWIKSNDDAEFIAKHPLWALGGNGGAGGTTNSLQFDFVWTF
ncbi:MAG: hypothetical protein LBD86_02270 [Spirochaetaceae bacterium]|jgi:hypothetical protein|nr:hypothetical protein [Spirochaetaceae bacterium]